MKVHQLAVLAVLALLFTLSPMKIGQAQPHLADSLLVHLDLDLDKSAISPTNVQVKLHATDGMSDQYYASQVDPGEGDEVEWSQDIPLTVDSNVSLRLIFHIADVNGGSIPSGYSVQWQSDLDGQSFQGPSVVIPAGSSGDMNLSVQGTVISQ